MMDWVERLAEEKIRRARDEGVFQRNRYRGKRVPLEPENPHLPREWWAAFHILEIHDLAPPWILRGRWIRQAIEAWRQELVWVLETCGQTPRRHRMLQRLRQRLETLNIHIREYNLSIPRSATPLAPLNWQDELHKAQRR